MHAIILAAGKSTRLYPLTSEMSKCLLPLAGVPIIKRIIDMVQKLGIEDVTIVTNQEYMNSFKDVLGNDFNYVVQPPEVKGTAAALLSALPLIEDDALVIAGDVAIEYEDIERLYNFHNSNNYTVSMLLARVDDPKRYGVVELSPDNLVLSINEKMDNPKSDLINASVYLVKAEFIQSLNEIQISSRGEYELTDGLNKYIASSKVGGLIINGYWNDIGIPWEYLNANEYFFSKLSESSINGVVINSTIKGPVIIEEGAIVENAYIKGPAYISSGAYIGPNAQIYPNTFIGANSVVSGGSTVKNSIILNDTNIKHLSYVGDSLISYKCNFGSSTQLANFRFDAKTVGMVVKGKMYDTGRKKFGAVVGPRVKLGVNTSVLPGKKIGRDALIYPGTVVSRDVDDGEFYKD